MRHIDVQVTMTWLDFNFWEGAKVYHAGDHRYYKPPKRKLTILESVLSVQRLYHESNP